MQEGTVGKPIPPEGERRILGKGALTLRFAITFLALVLAVAILAMAGQWVLSIVVLVILVLLAFFFFFWARG